MDKDADFDSYWLDESRNKNRNRIRVGRQYQATVPPLLKPGETDGRRCEDLETLKWKPEYDLSEQQLDHYLSVAKAVSLFARAINVYQENDAPQEKCLQTALRGLSEFVTSHHPCHHDAGCQKVPNKNSVNQSSTSGASSSFVTTNWLATATASWDTKEEGDSRVAGAASCSSLLGSLGRCEWTPQEADLFAKALEVCGKNFGAIKKEFLPWKPVKSIIEFYYCGKGDIKPSPDIKCPLFLQGNGGDSTKTECESAGPSSPSRSTTKTSSDMVAASDIESFPATVPEKKEVETDKEERLEAPTSIENSESEVENLDSNRDKTTEVEDSKMAPPPLSCQDSSSAVIKEESPFTQTSESSGSTVGSLKFYLGGQLVLKLNAQQDSSSAAPQETKCHWVQSRDTPKLALPPRKAPKSRKKLSQCGKSDSAESTRWSPNGPQDACGSTSPSPSDRDGTDSERSHTPDVWTPEVFVASKKAKVTRSPLTLPSSALPRLSPKPPWTPPIEYLRYEKSPCSSLNDDASSAELNHGSPKMIRTDRVKSELSPVTHSSIHRSSPLLGQRASPGLWDSNFASKSLMSGLLPRSSGFIKTPPPTSFPPPPSPDNKLTKGGKTYPMQFAGDHNPWGSANSVLGLPLICPTNYQSQDETPLDLSKKVQSKGCSNISQGSNSPRSGLIHGGSSNSSLQANSSESNEEITTKNCSAGKKSNKGKSVQINQNPNSGKHFSSSKRSSKFSLEDR